MKWAIWKSKVTDDTVRFIHLDDLPASGFASVYLFSEADARTMEATGTYKNFRGTVSSDTLKLDCDTEEISARMAVLLQTKKVAYSKYTTGGRGHHYHVPRVEQTSHILPTLDRAFVAREFPGADVSFYHHVGLYRQIGARHARTGNKKALLETVDGVKLDMTKEVLDDFRTTSTTTQNSNTPQSVFADPVLRILAIPYHNGERHNRYCAISSRLADIGQPIEWAFPYLANVNLMSESPLPDGELKRILEWAYYNRAKRD